MKTPDSDRLRHRLEQPTGKVDLVLDTDTDNEIDDQFALAWAVLLRDTFDLQAIYAAPFHNHRSTGPGDGMRRSEEEIHRILGVMRRPARGFVHRGSEAWISDTGTSVPSAARDDLIERARLRPDDAPLYVAAIGAITNVAAALLAAPEIREKLVLLWLGGHPLHWPRTDEFNFQGDLEASRVVLDCGVPLVLFPCRTVAELLQTTSAELQTHVLGRSPIADELCRLFMRYDHARLRTPGTSKVIWDLAPLAWLAEPQSIHTTLVPSPAVTDDFVWKPRADGHLIRIATRIKRDPVFRNFFRSLECDA